jgi:hypothetical protein
MNCQTLFTALLLLFTTNSLGLAAEDKAKVPAPKPITLKAVASDTVDSEAGIYTFASAAELAKKNPKLLEQFERAIDFQREDLILVQWGTSGPPFGKLTYKTDKTSITFTVEEPKVEVRGQAYKFGADWFTVAKGTKVVMSK